ncbi:MAG TPA: type II toxin-antitoxin system HicA family toxin [Prolixibacteraceae bacterium]|nr:type II toxin-antitoxin system HicA family toxin [Bacteroidales bacterium]HPB05293.1 type II toxin-antitoxin system HicA family toxin [Prolixibacteraceae bacterium]HQN92566.1 type II toxin-antitoxin system HicA family toxin [Prolixibacteraceae bacterium]
MKRIPRDISGQELVKALSQLGYSVTRQVGSHIRLSTLENGEHHITIPNHNPIRIGTLSNILNDIAIHFQFSKEEIIEKIF